MAEFLQRNSIINRLFIIIPMVITILFVFVFRQQTKSLNKVVNSIYYKLAGESQADSSLVIIHIDEQDIEQFGWPLKRSYYALLINRLNGLGAEKIALEVFLSPSLTSQSVYNNLLKNEIENSGNVILSAIAENIDLGNSPSSSFIFPAIKLPLKFLAHINFFTSDGIYIPGRIRSDSVDIEALSFKIADSTNLSGKIKVNFNLPWKSFTNYSLLEFFNKFKDNEFSRDYFKQKRIIIGVSDPTIAKTISTDFDDDLPGVGLHVIAANNLLKNEDINYGNEGISVIVFSMMWASFLFLPIPKKSNQIFTVVFLIFVITGYLAFIEFNYEINYSSFLLPLAVYLLAFNIMELVKNKIRQREIADENRTLEDKLKEKEKKIYRLHKELEVSPDAKPEAILTKIAGLKSEIERLKKEESDNRTAGTEPGSAEEYEGIIYKSRRMKSVIDLVERIAPEDVTALILGESGSGKELIARAIHSRSKRTKRNFVAVNCAALTSTLLESELFGHVKGAFTGANSDKPGRFEAADKGTIFLDEIGETDDNFQAKLLRVIQSGEFEKVGSSKTIKTDVRIIAATNKDLTKQVEEKKFREDLYYRLNVIKIELPPLRERIEDIEILADYFIKKENAGLELSEAVMHQLKENKWKGNVRELESVMKRAAIFAKTENRSIIKLTDLPAEYVNITKEDLSSLIIQSLRQKEFSHTSINETANELDISRTVVSENLRGLFFLEYAGSGFDKVEAAIRITGSTDKKLTDKIISKGDTYLNNLIRDIKKEKNKDFESIKKSFASKYKNLPQKYHEALDETIKSILS